MSENIKTPFEQARENITKFAENADMVYSLAELKKVIDSCQKLSEEEQEGINLVVEMAIKNLSQFMLDRGEKWN